MACHSPWTGLDSGSNIPLSVSHRWGPLSDKVSPYSRPRIPLPCVVALPRFIVLGQVLISACSLWSNISRDRIVNKTLSNTIGARGFPPTGTGEPLSQGPSRQRSLGLNESQRNCPWGCPSVPTFCILPQYGCDSLLPLFSTGESVRACPLTPGLSFWDFVFARLCLV